MIKKLNKERIQKINPILIIIIAVLIFLGGFFIGRLDLTNKSDIGYVLKGDVKSSYQEVNVNTLWDVWDKLEANYLKEDLDGNLMLEGAIKGLVESLNDPYTSYLSQEETVEYLQGNAGAFEGIGTVLRYNGEHTEIETPLVGYPALEAGLRSGDIICKVDDVSVEGKRAFEVAKLVKGKAGTTVKIEIIRKGHKDPLVFEIVRVKVDLDSITVEYPEKDIAHIKISQFTESSLLEFQKQWDQAVKDLNERKIDKVIVDLRNNPGGYVDGVKYVASEFFASDTLLFSERDREGRMVYTKSSRDGKLQSIKLVVLVNEGSASASEIFAGAIQDNKRGEIIGMPTVGKGVEQRIMTLSNGASLHIVFQEWVLPSGRTINKDEPISPDYKIDYSEEDFVKKNDTQLNKALELLAK